MHGNKYNLYDKKTLTLILCDESGKHFLHDPLRYTFRRHGSRLLSYQILHIMVSGEAQTGNTVLPGKGIPLIILPYPVRSGRMAQLKIRGIDENARGIYWTLDLVLGFKH